MFVHLCFFPDVVTSSAPFFFTSGILMVVAMPFWLIGRKPGKKKLLIFVAAVLFITAGESKVVPQHFYEKNIFERKISDELIST